MRKIKLSPIEREILWTLEEAGAESISTLEATIKIIIKGFSKEVFSQSLDNLKSKEFIEFETNNNNISVILTDKGKISLSV